MKTRLHLSTYLIVSVTVLTCSCTKISVPYDTPSCVKNKIRKIQAKSVYNPPASVSLWEFEGKKYYYFTSDCCDQMTELFDEDCDLVCHPDGGLTGKGDGKCPDFSTGVLKRTVIWSDKR